MAARKQNRSANLAAPQDLQIWSFSVFVTGGEIPHKTRFLAVSGKWAGKPANPPNSLKTTILTPKRAKWPVKAIPAITLENGVIWTGRKVPFLMVLGCAGAKMSENREISTT